MKNIRIKDIAKTAGVSVGTVDRVLHNRGKVSEDALKKVMDVLSQYEYKPNLIARTLGSNKTYKLVALIPDPEHDPYWAITSLGIAQAEIEWQHYGVQVITCPFSLQHKDSFTEASKKVLAMQPDGVLIAPIFYHETLPLFDELQKQNIPFVLFNTYIRESKALTFIGQNLYESGRVAAGLICFGQTLPAKFAVLHIDEDLNDSVHLLEKERGFKEQVKEIFGEEAEVESLNRTSSSDFSFKKNLAKLLSEKNLKGIFVSTSQATSTAAGFLSNERKHNIIRLVGYDMLDKNVSYLQNDTIDFLIHQKPQQQAFLGVTCLVNHLVFKKGSPAVNLFPLEVITKQNLDSYLQSEREHKNGHEVLSTVNIQS